jgi:PhnB protein
VTAPRLPHGYHNLNPYIVANDVETLIGFLVRVFHGEELERTVRPNGRIEHSDVLIGDSILMLSEADDAYPPRPSVVFAYVENVDMTIAEAVDAGARLLVSASDRPWGDRVGGFIDQADNRWWVATHLSGD